MAKSYFYFAAIALFCCSTGCISPSLFRSVHTANYQPSNVYQANKQLGNSVKRVAILPLGTLTHEPSMEFGRNALWPLLLGELGRSKLFELVIVSGDELRSLTGRDEWVPDDRLPSNLFEKLQGKLAVDAILFSQLTAYRPYEPVAIGWRLKLVDVNEPEVLWAIDEVFDARLPEVAASARRFTAGDSSNGLSSPRRFGSYTANAVVQTLPRRRDASSH